MCRPLYSQQRMYPSYLSYKSYLSYTLKIKSARFLGKAPTCYKPSVMPFV